MIYDLIVIGSGSVGAATGYYATLNDLNVLMIDAHHPPHQHGSHHGNTRLIRYLYPEGDHYIPLLKRSRQLWHDLEEQSATSLLTRSGVLNFAPVDSPLAQQLKQAGERCCSASETLSAQQVRQRWPQITVTDDYEAILDSEGGFIACEKAIEQWIRLAREAGCAQLFNCPVSAIDFCDDIYNVSTADGDYFAKKIVVTAGSWVKNLLPDLPITPLRKTVTWYQSDARFSHSNQFPAFTAQLIDGSHYYGFPAQDDQLKIGRHDGGQPINSAADCLPFGEVAGDGSDCFPFIKRFIPGQSTCLFGQACSYDNSPDGHFIIDYIEGRGSALVITGLSGHGFKFAPVLGEIASQFASEQDISATIKPFRLQRFN